MIACLELHTYSSLNSEFLNQYVGALDSAEVAVVFYSPEAVDQKKLEAISAEQIYSAFQRKDLIIYTRPEEFQSFLKEQDFNNSVLLLMSSGTYVGLDFEEIKNWVG